MEMSDASEETRAKVVTQKLAALRDKLSGESTDGRRRKMSETAKARISAAQKARWAKRRKSRPCKALE